MKIKTNTRQPSPTAFAGLILVGRAEYCAFTGRGGTADGPSGVPQLAQNLALGSFAREQLGQVIQARQ